MHSNLNALPASKQAPTAPPAPNWEGIPAELKAARAWVLWRLEERDGKLAKVPRSIVGKLASSTDPGTWATFDAVRIMFNKGGFSGVGFVFAADGPFCGVDFDHVRNASTGEWEPEAKATIMALGSYGELSPSGTGAHVLLRVKDKAALKGLRAGKVEFYPSGRYFTVTGRHLEGTPADVREAPDLPGFLEKHFTPKPEAPAVTAAPEGSNWRAFLSRDVAQGEPGGRHGAAAKITGGLFAQGLKPRDVGPLLSAWNEAHAKPPLSRVELEKIVRDFAPQAEELDGLEIDSQPWPEPLAPEAFHGLAGEIVKAIEPHAEADSAALLITVLGAFGVAAGRGPHFYAGGSPHFLNLYAAVVGATSKARKGTSARHVLRFFEAADPDFYGARIVDGLSSGEGLLWAVRDATKAPSPKGEGDAGESDKRLFVQEGELSNALRAMARDGSTLSPTLRNAWDTGRLRSLTTGRSKAITQSTGAHIGLLGHVTVSELRQLLGEGDVLNGLANRVLWICARRQRLLPDGGRVPDEIFAPLAAELDRALVRARGISEMRRDARAAELWRAVYGELSADRPGLLGAATARAEAQAVRLSMIYAALDGSATITTTHLEAALAVWEYAEASARYLFGDSTGDATADSILAAVRSSGQGLTGCEISCLFHRNKSADDLRKALRRLFSLGLIEPQPVKGKGRPSTRWAPAGLIEKEA